jgi:hypothetical protein
MSDAPTLATTPTPSAPPAAGNAPAPAPSTIPGYATMTFEQRRLAQDRLTVRRPGR